MPSLKEQQPKGSRFIEGEEEAIRGASGKRRDRYVVDGQIEPSARGNLWGERVVQGLGEQVAQQQAPEEQAEQQQARERWLKQQARERWLKQQAEQQQARERWLEEKAQEEQAQEKIAREKKWPKRKWADERLAEVRRQLQESPLKELLASKLTP